MLKKVNEILNSAWFNSAAIGAAGVAVLFYGYKLYAGLLLGWGINSAIRYLKSIKK